MDNIIIFGRVLKSTHNKDVSNLRDWTVTCHITHHKQEMGCKHLYIMVAYASQIHFYNTINNYFTEAYSISHYLILNASYFMLLMACILWTILYPFIIHYFKIDKIICNVNVSLLMIMHCNPSRSLRIVLVILLLVVRYK
jgi:hypothetical protein